MNFKIRSLIVKFKKAFNKFKLLISSKEDYREIVFQEISSLNFDNMPNEEVELLLLKYFLNKESVFFDIGANLGVYSYQASKIVDEANIYAFEPIPDSFKKLSKAFEKSNLYNLAFSSKKENSKANFKIPIIKGKEYKTRGTLNTQFKEDDETSFELIQVKLDTLDHFVRVSSIRKIDFIKIDVEGHEEEVIKGGMEVISKFTPVLQIEIEQRHNQFNISRIIDSLKSVGYLCYYFDPSVLSFKELKVEPALLQRKEDFKTPNYINNFYFLHNLKYTNNSINVINEDIKLRRSGHKLS